MKGFRNFVFRGNIVELAVAFVIGLAFKDLITAFVDDIVNPVLAIFGGKPDFSAVVLGPYNNALIKIGSFVTALIAFLIIAAAIYYMLVKPMESIQARHEKAAAEHPTATCPECLGEIPAGAHRCMHCTAVITAVVPAA